ncbi:MAG TPA: hypothetical protein VKC61_22720 [Pyrinomonadaceae bacterium]|nr:hypothetical protein [Pyrinomonadaceae bacterium]
MTEKQKGDDYDRHDRGHNKSHTQRTYLLLHATVENVYAANSASRGAGAS